MGVVDVVGANGEWVERKQNEQIIKYNVLQS